MACEDHEAQTWLQDRIWKPRRCPITARLHLLPAPSPLLGSAGALAKSRQV